MNTYHVEPYLRRQPRRRIIWRDVGLMLLGAVVAAVAFFVILMDWGKMMAHAQGAAGIIKGETFYTPQQFCDTL